MNILYIGDANSIHNLKWASNFASKDENKVFFLPSDKPFNEKRKHDNISGISAIEFFDPIPVFSLVKFLRSINTIRRLKKIISRYKIDIVHVLFVAPSAIWGLFIKTKLILTSRGSDVLIVIPQLKNTGGLRKLHNNILFYLFRKAFEKADSVTSTSKKQIDSVMNMFGKYLKNQPKLIRTGINVDAVKAADENFYGPLPDGRKLIFSPRLIGEVYDTMLQLDAISLLDDELLKSLFFVFVKGQDNHYFKLIEKRLNEIKTSKPFFSFMVYYAIPQNMMFSLYKKSSLVIMTPKSDGTPNSALEAMALSRPLIISNLDYDDDIFNGTCLKLNNRTPEYLAELIKKALSDYSGEMLQKAEKTVFVNGNIKFEIEKIEKLYQELI